MKNLVKKISLVITMVMAMCLMLPAPISAATSSPWDGTIAGEFAGGSGTKADPYLIETPQQLALMASKVNASNTTSNSFRGAYYKLEADLDLGGEYWTPIGYSGTSTAYYFTGTFIGQGHTISNMKVAVAYDAGLFGNITGNICDFTILNANVKATTTRAGALAGSFSDSTLVCNVHVKDSTITGVTGVGGLVGEATNESGNTTRIKRSTVDHTSVQATKQGAGGILGMKKSNGGSTVIEGSSNTNGTVVAAHAGVGGIAGMAGTLPNSVNSGPIEISDCFNTSDIKGTMHYPSNGYGVGGILGYNYNSYTKVTRCWNAGDVVTPQGTSQNSSFASGIVGYNMAGTVTSCLNKGNISTSGTSTTYKSYTRLSPIDGYGNKATYSFYLAGTLGSSSYATLSSTNGTSVATEEDWITKLNLTVKAAPDYWTITEGNLPTLIRCTQSPDDNCTCGCFCIFHPEENPGPVDPDQPDQPELPDHVHKDENGDGFCDDCGDCMHDHDGNGNCTEEGCTHPEGCCPKEDQDPSDEKTNEPGIFKTANKDTAAAGDIVEFTLESNVPDYLYKYIHLETGTYDSYPLQFSDTMNEGYLFNNDVTITVNGNELRGDLYSVTVNPEDGSTFHIDMDLSAICMDGSVFTYADIINSPKIVVTYSATLKDNLLYGVFENSASVSYEGKTSSTSRVDVNMYAIKVEKTDAEDGSNLSGAVFALYKDEGCTEEVSRGVTVEDGSLFFTGLEAGTYYLKEVEAPAGYIRVNKVLTCEVHDLFESNNLYVLPFVNAKAPHTGGEGTLMFTLAGGILILVAGMILRKETSAE